MRLETYYDDGWRQTEGGKRGKGVNQGENEELRAVIVGVKLSVENSSLFLAATT